MPQFRWSRSCPLPPDESGPRILLGHGEGARLTRRLLQDVVIRTLCGTVPRDPGDAAVLPAATGRLVISTDSFTVSPIFFPGGDLGSLSVIGTLNDVSVSGAVPKWLTCSLILEEGLSVAVLQQILNSAAAAAAEYGVQIVAGDTKVVPRGAVDGIFINTCGVGELREPVPAGPESIRSGDDVVLSGVPGRHGIALLNARGILQSEQAIISDCRSVFAMMEVVRQCGGSGVRAVRDATRGGVSAVLHEWAESCGLTFVLEELQIPESPEIRGACELLGLDPLHIANEGTIVIAAAPESSEAIVHGLRDLPGCESAAIIGRTAARGICPVTIRRIMGIEQPFDEPSGAPLPRIC